MNHSENCCGDHSSHTHLGCCSEQERNVYTRKRGATQLPPDDWQTVEAVQFDPEEKKWPRQVIAWSQFTPRDMSWGFAGTIFGQVHVHAGDWIVTSGEKVVVVKDKIFNQLYEAVI